MATVVQAVDRQELLKRVEMLYPEALDQISHAVDFAAAAHGDQARASGEPYIIHPIEVAGILADLRLDVPTIIAGLLHDTPEDTSVTLDDVRREFGDTVANIVRMSIVRMSIVRMSLMKKY